MRRNPTNKTKTATDEIASTIQTIRKAMSDAARFRKNVLDFMGDASFLVTADGDMLAQRVSTKSGGMRLELL